MDHPFFWVSGENVKRRRRVGGDGRKVAMLETPPIRIPLQSRTLSDPSRILPSRTHNILPAGVSLVTIVETTAHTLDDTRENRCTGFRPHSSRTQASTLRGRRQ